MPKPQSVIVADAVASALNVQRFDEAFVAKVGWAPEKRVESGAVKGLAVTVIPVTRATEDIARSKARRDFGIVVVLQKHVGPDPDPSKIDDLVYVAEQVYDHLDGDPLIVSFGRVRAMDVEIDPICDAESLTEIGVFQSAARITYRAFV